VDVFPSLHCAASAFVLAFDRRQSRGRFWVFLVPVVGLWFSTLYLRFHYLVDLVAGFALAALALRVVACRREPSLQFSGDGPSLHRG
jgi:membrane-associated phospholipid phosphatase